MGAANVCEIVFVIFTLILLGYYILIWKKLAFFKSENNEFKELPFVSVIICAKNEKDNLTKFLPEILNQNYPDFEVIVVDDNSEDGSLEILNKFSVIHDNLKPFKFQKHKKSFGKKEVLEFGIDQAISDYLIMTDADCMPNSKYWLLEMVNGFSDGSELVLGVGQYERDNTWINKLIQLDTGFIALNYLSFALVKFPYMSVGRNVGYKKDLYRKVGGFKSHYDIPSGDDDIFVNEISRTTKISIVTSLKGQTTSVPKSDFKSFFTQKVRHVSAGLKYNKLNLFFLSLFYSISGLWYLSLPFVIYYSDQLIVFLTVVTLKKLTMYALINRIFSKIGLSVSSMTILLTDFVSVFVHNIAVLVTTIKSKEGKW